VVGSKAPQGLGEFGEPDGRKPFWRWIARRHRIGGVHQQALREPRQK
jgi:hypothetical protein